jgi:hypothetical protein
VEMAPDDKPKTQFATRRGLFEFNVIPFGLSCAPATFERLMESVLGSTVEHMLSLLGCHFCRRLKI